MDESGTSRQSPFLVVAGVIVHADTQLGPIEDSLRGLIENYVSPQLREGFIFHATDLFRGDNDLPPEIQDQAVRHEMLEKLMAIPARHQVQLCYGFIKKEKFRAFNATRAADGQRLRIAMHAAAIALCTVAAEDWLRYRAKNEVAMLFAENNDEVRVAARKTQILMRSSEACQKLNMAAKRLLPLQRIKDGINFVTKEESLALQLADCCAWSVRKYLTNSKDPTSHKYFDPIKELVRCYGSTAMDAAALL
jgi:hypothetical protein